MTERARAQPWIRRRTRWPAIGGDWRDPERGPRKPAPGAARSTERRYRYQKGSRLSTLRRTDVATAAGYYPAPVCRIPERFWCGQGTEPV